MYPEEGPLPFEVDYKAGAVSLSHYQSGELCHFYVPHLSTFDNALACPTAHATRYRHKGGPLFSDSASRSWTLPITSSPCSRDGAWNFNQPGQRRVVAIRLESRLIQTL